MHRPLPARSSLTSRKACLALAAAGAVLGLGAAVPTPALAQANDDEWTQRLTLGLSARDLGLRPEASARRVARAALARNAGRLGVPRSLRGVRLARTRHVPRGPRGARELHLLRFQQTVRGTRVLWSQIDVTIAAGTVSSIAATVVPVTGRRLADKPKVGRNRALRIARRAVNGPEQALRPLRVAYAGRPTTERSAKARTARLAWVVETTPASSLGAETPSPLCIIVDARTGKVIGRWRGIAARPDRGPQARGADTARAGRPTTRASARAAQANPMQFLLDVYDGSGAALDRSDPFDGTTSYAAFVIDGDPHRGANWPPFLDSPPWSKPCTEHLAPRPCLQYLATRDDDMDVVATNARNVAFTTCARRDFCGRQHGLQGDSGFYAPWAVIGNGKASRTYPSTLTVEIADEDDMDGTCPGSGECGDGPLDPRPPFNDIVAHEFGHVMDFVYAGDRALQDDLGPEAESVQEALADMFAYDYDREDATLGEQTGHIDIRWDDPESSCGVFPGDPTHVRCYPAHMRDYDPTPPDEHYNSTILSHAYYLLVQEVGHDRAGNVLQYVPFFLSPKPSFEQVAQGFTQRAHDLYGPEVSTPAANAFADVGLPTNPPDEPEPPEEPDCGPEAC